MNKSLDEEFPLAEKWIYLDNAAQGVPPQSTLRVMEEYVKDRCDWLSGSGDWVDCMGKWASRVENSKNLFAKIIGADSDEVAFIPNTTTGINTVFNMLPIKPGQKIVTTSISYPMGAAVCLKQGERGAEIKFLKGVRGEVPLEEFEKNIDDKTSAVLVDQAGWYNGYLHDLRAISTIAHEHGAYLIVDAVQSAGAYPHNVHRDGVDFLSVSTYKWLLGGPYSQSVGYLYINRELIDRFQPAYIGNQTIMDDQLQSNIYDKFDLYTLKYKRGITRIQIYPRCEFSYVAVENSMRVLLNYGIKNIFDKIKKLGTIMVDGLQEMGVELQTPIEPEKRLYVNAKFKNHRELEKMLYRQNIVLSSRVGGLRISPHFYVEENAVETFLERLKKLSII